MREDTLIDDTISETDYGYTGQENNSSIRWMNYNARWYSPTLGSEHNVFAVYPAGYDHPRTFTTPRV